MSLDPEQFWNFQKAIESTKFNFTDDYLNSIKETFESINSISFDNLFKNLPATRKSNPKTAIGHLKTAYNEGNLNLVLGAGISVKYGLPHVG